MTTRLPCAAPACAVLLALAGCGPTTESERAYFAAREAERLEHEEMRRAITTPLPDQEVLALVREEDSPDGAGTMMDWVQRQIARLKGQVLFPRWQVTRRGSSKYEVRYTFTWIDATNHISSKGYFWIVDGGLRLVGAPHELDAVEVGPRVRTPAEVQQQRIRDEEYSLE